MAYQARGRDPLFDSDMATAIEKRGKELLGLVLLALGAAAAALVLSYTPDDPSWMSATDAPVQNWMGRIGATIAAPLVMIVGWGSLGIGIVLMAWGMRFAVHRGTERALGRVIFAPIWVALVAVYASTMPPGQAWNHPFGLGGLFGDTVLSALLTLLPVGAGIGTKLMSLAFALGIVAFGAFVLGFTRHEVRSVGRFLLVGLVMSYAGLLAMTRRGAVGAAHLARRAQEAHAERRGRREEAQATAAQARAEAARQAPAHRVTQPYPEENAPARAGLLARMPSLIRRPEPLPEPELVEAVPVAGEQEIPGDDRIRARIADAIKARVRQTPPLQVETAAPLTRGRGRRPDPLVLASRSHAVPPKAEPPLTGPAARVPAEPLLAAHPAQAALPGHAAAEPPLTAQPRAQVPPAPADLTEDEDAIWEPWEDTPEQAAPEQVVPAAPRPQVPQPEPRKVVQNLQRKAPAPSRRAQEEAQPRLQFEDRVPDYELPPLGLLMNPATIQRHHLSDEALEQNARMLEAVLDDYGVKGEIVSVRPGPVVTMYELEPAPGLKASRVIGLADDIARSMSALSARVSTVPGRSVIGIELPNDNREMVVLREILAARDFGDSNMKLPLALGKDIGGDPIVANLAKMPHLLIAGTTGSGKSVAINTMILSLLYKLTPAECRLIMIDPKMLELSVYDGIPHLLSPVVTDPKKAVVALKWVVAEMEERYRKMSKMGVRNIDGYNGRVADAQAKGEMFSRTVQTGFDEDTGEPIFETEEFEPRKMPFIVVIVDEMADLMMVAGKEIEACIQRLAQMARASGIHLIMATQRPSVDVITGTIKANFPTRISFQVTSKIDSRTILGEMGAEQLLGMGDMLYMAGGAKITRCHGPFVSDEEVEEIVNHLKAYGPPDYVGGVLEGPDEERSSDIDAVLGLSSGGNTGGEDALYDQAVAIVAKDRKCSTSYIQRKLGIGYNKAARLVEQMEDEGVVTPANHVGKREILLPEPQ